MNHLSMKGLLIAAATLLTLPAHADSWKDLKEAAKQQAAQKAEEELGMAQAASPGAKVYISSRKKDACDEAVAERAAERWMRTLPGARIAVAGGGVPISADGSTTSPNMSFGTDLASSKTLYPTKNPYGSRDRRAPVNPPRPRRGTSYGAVAAPPG